MLYFSRATFSSQYLLSVFMMLVILTTTDATYAQPAETNLREGLLNGAPDPTGVAVTNAAGGTVYYVAATGRGVKSRAR